MCLNILYVSPPLRRSIDIDLCGGCLNEQRTSQRRPSYDLEGVGLRSCIAQLNLSCVVLCDGLHSAAPEDLLWLGHARLALVNAPCACAIERDVERLVS